MKFMQRAAASDSKSPRTPSEPAAKKQRLSNGSFNSSPAPPQNPHPEAPSAEQQRREDFLAREASERGETKWYLSFQEAPSPAISSPLRVVSAGYGALDSRRAGELSSEEDEDVPQMQGRMNFGKFSRKAEVI